MDGYTNIQIIYAFELQYYQKGIVKYASGIMWVVSSLYIHIDDYTVRNPAISTSWSSKFWKKEAVVLFYKIRNDSTCFLSWGCRSETSTSVETWMMPIGVPVTWDAVKVPTLFHVPWLLKFEEAPKLREFRDVISAFEYTIKSGIKLMIVRQRVLKSHILIASVH